MDLHRALGDPARYRRQIDRLHQRYLFSSELYELRQGDVALARFIHHRRRVARILARAVRRGEYRMEPGTVRQIVVKEKRREVYSFRLSDLIVHGVVGAAVHEAAGALLSDRLYSYRKGVSWWAGVSDLARYVRDHTRERRDPRDRGLYVLRRDVDSYTDSIPVGRDSPVWPMLRDLFDQPIRSQDWALLQEVVRPTMETPPDGAICRFRGIPTGQPISVALFNLYLAGMDRELDSLPGAFYGRYSDDLVFAHPDPGVVQRARVRMDEVLAGLGLSFKEEKDQLFYLTGPGRHSSEWPEARPASWVPFLGTQVWGDGRVSLGKSKSRALLRDIRERGRRTARAAGPDPDSRGRAVATVVNEILDPHHSPFQQRSATLLRRAVTDRDQLRHLDYVIARSVIASATGERDVRAFRRVPYRKVREEWGLVSLLHARNRWGKDRQASA